MGKTFENKTEPDRAVLVGVGVGAALSESDLDELAALAETCNIKTVGRIVQNRKDVDVAFYVGRGKADEIAEMVKETGANAVIFDVELSGSKVRNLEGVLGVAVLDRSQVILDIFAQRAQSMEGKLQVELAQLKYNLPRLVGAGGLMSKMRSAVGMRGPGEKKLELDKRTIRNQIAALEERLQKVAENRKTNRKAAEASGKARVCLVGYTNSGKSTLLNTIAKAGAVAEDKLFATLDPKTAKVFIQLTMDDGQWTGAGGVQVLLTDTVGFIDKLPHEFIRAFESTLDEARYADLLLHVVDISNPNFRAQLAVVNAVLGKIGAAGVPVILVLNKADRLSAEEIKEIELEAVRVFGVDSVTVSARENRGIEILKQKILRFVDGRGSV
jgi:GTP-binding protein HflX